MFEEIMIFMLKIYEPKCAECSELLSSENHDESFQSSCKFSDESES